MRKKAKRKNNLFCVFSIPQKSLFLESLIYLYCADENDEEKITALVTLYRKIYTIIALVITAVGLCFLPFLDYVINTDLNIPHLRLYYLIALFNTVVSYLFAYKQSLISADQKMHIIQMFATWMAIFKIIFQNLKGIP